jgi:hypothetical protein
MLIKISNEHHRSFHFCRAVLSTHSFFKPDFSKDWFILKMFSKLFERRKKSERGGSVEDVANPERQLERRLSFRNPSEFRQKCIVTHAHKLVQINSKEV